MPTYDYACETCGHRVSIFRKISEAAHEPPCPKCKKKTKRVFSSPGLIFKGSGWTPKHFPKNSD